jgi:hypothetical protein
VCSRADDPSQHDDTPRTEAESLLRAASLLPNDGIVVPRIREYLSRIEAEAAAGPRWPEHVIDELKRLAERDALTPVERWMLTEAAAGPRDDGLREIAEIVKRHTHQGRWAMTRYAGDNPEDDCLLCRALVAAGVLTIDEIGSGTRAAATTGTDHE